MLGHFIQSVKRVYRFMYGYGGLMKRAYRFMCGYGALLQSDDRLLGGLLKSGNRLLCGLNRLLDDLNSFNSSM